MSSTQQQPTRSLGRVPVSIQAEYQYKKTRSSCIITDLGWEGLAVAVRQLFVEGDSLRVKATLPNSSISIDIWCVVRSIQGCKAELQFDEISEKQRQEIQGYIYSLLDTSKLDKK